MGTLSSELVIDKGSPFLKSDFSIWALPLDQISSDTFFRRSSGIFLILGGHTSCQDGLGTLVMIYQVQNGIRQNNAQKSLPM